MGSIAPIRSNILLVILTSVIVVVFGTPVCGQPVGDRLPCRSSTHYFPHPSALGVARLLYDRIIVMTVESVS